MNIYDLYLDKIKDIIIKINKDDLIKLPENLNGINVDIPPPNFNCDISTNVSMVLSKINKKTPLEIAEVLVKFIKQDDTNIENITVVKPGFINIKFKNYFWNNFVEKIITDHKNFGVNNKEKKKKYLIEYV